MAVCTIRCGSDLLPRLTDNNYRDLGVVNERWSLNFIGKAAMICRSRTISIKYVTGR